MEQFVKILFGSETMMEADGNFNRNIITEKGSSSYTDSTITELTTLIKIMDVAPLCLNLWNSKFENVLCNKQAVVLFGVKDEEQYLSDFFKLSPKHQPNGRLSNELAHEHISSAFNTGYNKFSWLHCDINGEEIPCEITLKKVLSDNNEEFVAGFTRDLRSEFLGGERDNQYKNYFLNKISDKTLLNKLTELSEEWFFALDIRTSIIQYYGKVVNDFGYNGSISVQFGTALDRGMIHNDDIDLYISLKENMLAGIYEPIDIRYLQKDSSYKYFRLIYQTITDDNDNPVFVVGKGLDIHEQKMLEERSKVDLLTGCYNKISAEQLITQKLIELKDKSHALFIVDVDNFKAVNDNLGHFFGDEVLREVSHNLKSSFRSQDLIARIGGDEFIVFIENITSDTLLKTKAQRIVDAFCKTYSGEDNNYAVSGSVGIALYPDAGVAYDTLYKAADKALYQAKLLGKNQFVFYNDSLIDGTMRNLTRLENADKIASSYFDYDLISSVFNILYERNGDAVSINFALQYICQKYNTDRSYIFETFNDGETYSNTFEWCRAGVNPEIDNLQDIPRPLYDEFFDNARNGVIYSNDLSDMIKNPQAYKIMADQGIKSFVHSQIKKDGNVTFFLGLDDCTKARVWSEKEINSMQYLSKVLSLMRQGENMHNEIVALMGYNKMSAFISDSLDDIVYISDLDDYSLIYLNKAAIQLLGNPRESEWKGKKCYKLLQGKDSPCEFCTNDQLNDEDFYEWTYYNPIFNKTYLLKDKLIQYGDKLVRIEIATDITIVKSLEAELQEKLEEERLLFSCVDTLHSGKNPHLSINRLLEIIATYHDAERSYIFDMSESGETLRNTFEWCAPGAKPQIELLQNVPRENLSGWYEKFNEIGEFYISSVEDDLGPESPDYEILASQDIESLVTAPIRDSNGELTGFIGVDNPKQNITKTELLRSVARFIANFLDETELLAELNRLSYYDILTGVKNRHSYRKELFMIEKTDLNSLSVAYIDIKGLRSINELKGTQFGDSVIRRVANILTGIFGEHIYRVGGDEFVILKQDLSEDYFEEEIKRLKEIFKNEDDYTVSLGYTWNKNFDMQDSDQKFAAGQKYTAILSENLEKEIQNQKFVVYLQPQIDMKTGCYNSAEALIRRKNFDGTIQPPIAFLPFYEKEGIISKIDLFVFETVCKHLKAWKDAGFNRDMTVSVNCSRITVSEKKVVKQFCDLCDRYSVDRSAIVIEITETISSTNDEVLAGIISNIKGAGFSISLDDFGNGYSNLSTLKISDFDEIKIDMGLVNNLHTDAKSLSLTKVGLNLCDELDNLISVAEGIEVIEQYDILKALNCNKGQGYYFAKPMPIEEFTEKYIKI